MADLSISTKTGWIVSNVDERQISEVQYLELDIIPSMMTLMNSKAVYFTTNGGKVWERANHLMSPTVYTDKETAQNMVESMYEKKMQRFIDNNQL